MGPLDCTPRLHSHQALHPFRPVIGINNFNSKASTSYAHLQMVLRDAEVGGMGYYRGPLHATAIPYVGTASQSQ